MTDSENVIFLQCVLVLVMVINLMTFTTQRRTIRRLQDRIKDLGGR